MTARSLSGVSWIVISCLIGAGFEVFLGRLVQSLEPAVVVTACCGALVTGHLIYELVRNGRSFLAKARGSWRELALFNVSSSLGIWAGSAALRWLEPSSARVIGSSVGPVLTVLLGPLLIKGLKTDSRKAAAVAGTGLSCVLLVWGALTGATGVVGVSTGEAALGIAAAVACGLGVVVNTLLMKKFEKKGWSISEMLACRFLLVTLLGLCFWPRAGAPGAPGLSDVPALLAVTLGWIWVPIYTFQWGLQRSDPVTAALIIAASPILILMFQSLDSRLVYSAVTVAAIGLNTASAVFGQWPRSARVFPRVSQ